VDRVSHGGEVIGPDQREVLNIALKSMTEWAAYPGFTLNLKGTLYRGKLADLVILNKNP
jgi:predicted amidohydrolase YtcJ